MKSIGYAADRLWLFVTAIVMVMFAIIAWCGVALLLLPSILHWTITRTWPEDDGR